MRTDSPNDSGTGAAFYGVGTDGSPESTTADTTWFNDIHFPLNRVDAGPRSPEDGHLNTDDSTVGNRDGLDLTGFTPEMILQYVQTRLADIDGQIKDIMGDVNDKKARSEELRRFQAAIRSLVGVGGKGSGYDSTTGASDQTQENAKAKASLDQAMDAIKDNPTLVKKLQALEDQILREPGGSKISAEQLQNELDYAKDQLTSLNSDNELTMMRLNMLTQHRSQIISSASNEQASINDGMKNVISNMRA
jgi:hypothetical protein